MADEAVAQDALFQLTGVGVVQTDMRTGRFVRANETFRELLGYSAAELRGMTYLELTHPDDRARDAASFAALGRGEHRGDTALTRVTCKDGAVVWLELHVTVVQDDIGSVYTIAVVNDVTERGRAEERYHTLFNSVDEGCLLADVLFDEMTSR